MDYVAHIGSHTLSLWHFVAKRALDANHKIHRNISHYMHAVYTQKPTHLLNKTCSKNLFQSVLCYIVYEVQYKISYGLRHDHGS